MPESIYSIRVWHRRSPRARWVFQEAFASGQAATDWIGAEKAKGRLRGETLTIVGDRDPNTDAKGARR